MDDLKYIIDRIDKAEEKIMKVISEEVMPEIKALQSFKSRVIGGSMVVSAVVTAAFHIILKQLK